MRRSSNILIALAVGTLFTLAAIAPFALMLLPNPVPVKVADASQQSAGTYILGRDGTYHVFQYAEQLDTFPAESLRTDPDARIVVRYKALDDLAMYGLYSLPSERPVKVAKAVAEKVRMLTLTPQRPLPPGRYVVTISSEGMFGGTDFAYFSVTATPAISTAATGVTSRPSGQSVPQ